MITQSKKEEDIQFITTNNIITDASNSGLRKPTLDSLISKKSIDNHLTEPKIAAISPHSTNSKLKQKAPNKAAFIKLFKEDEEEEENSRHKSQSNIQNEKGESFHNKDDSESNDYDNYINNPYYKDEDPFEKANRRLCKREKIVIHILN